MRLEQPSNRDDSVPSFVVEASPITKLIYRFASDEGLHNEIFEHYLVNGLLDIRR